jgi:hypothetical protein
MQIVSLRLDHYNFYSPSTGEWITQETDINEDAVSLLGYWVDEFWEEPFIKDDELKKHWQNYLANFEQFKNHDQVRCEYDMLRDFFKSIPFNNVLVFEISDNNAFSRTGYFVIDLNCQLP